jgi:hypothetical protein
MANNSPATKKNIGAYIHQQGIEALATPALLIFTLISFAYYYLIYYPSSKLIRKKEHKK